jgi:hypothetical protein
MKKPNQTLKFRTWNQVKTQEHDASDFLDIVKRPEEVLWFQYKGVWYPVIGKDHNRFNSQSLS